MMAKPGVLRWECPECGYMLSKEEIRANLEEGSFDKPSTIVVACPDCVEAIPYRKLKPIIKQDRGGKG